MPLRFELPFLHGWGKGGNSGQILTNFCVLNTTNRNCGLLLSRLMATYGVMRFGKKSRRRHVTWPDSLHSCSIDMNCKRTWCGWGKHTNYSFSTVLRLSWTFICVSGNYTCIHFFLITKWISEFLKNKNKFTIQSIIVSHLADLNALKHATLTWVLSLLSWTFPWHQIKEQAGPLHHGRHRAFSGNQSDIRFSKRVMQSKGHLQ